MSPWPLTMLHSPSSPVDMGDASVHGLLVATTGSGHTCVMRPGRSLRSAARRSRRDLISSLPKTLPRCHSTSRHLSRAGRRSPGWCGRRQRDGRSAAPAASADPAFDAPFAHGFAGGQKLPTRSLGEGLHTDRDEQVVCGSELVPGVNPSAFPSEPLPVEKMRSSEVRAEARPAETTDGLLVQPLGVAAIAQQGARTSLDPKREVGAGRQRRLGQPFERQMRLLGSPVLSAASMSSGSIHIHG